MSEEESIAWSHVAWAIVVSLLLVTAFVWCLKRAKQADPTEGRLVWRRWSIISGGALLLWTIGLTWSIVDFASFPLNF